MDAEALERSVIESVSGTVLEIGAGSGENFDVLPKGITWIGLEPDDRVLATLRNRSFRFSRSSRVIEGVGESIPLEDASIDTVLGTLVLCSVEDPAGTLAEIERVLKPGGRFVFVEHVAAPPRSLLRFAQRILAGPTRRRAGECDPLRGTLASIRARFDSVEVTEYSARGALWLSIPHIAGSAVKSGR